MQSYSASAIFTGHHWITGQAVVVEEGKITAIIPETESQESKFYADCLMVPAFIDVQVYGAEKKLLAVYPQASTLEVMYTKFIRQGTCLFLPTLATNSLEVFRAGIDAIKTYWQENGKGVAGLHLEGPWINVEKRGAHVKDLIHSPTLNEVKQLLDYGQGVISMITLAPENCSQEIIDLIRSYKIVVSAGHSNASFTDAIKSFDSGVSAITHLYNAMSPLHHREPGLVGAAFQHDRVMASIIPDGHHVDYSAIAIAKKMMGPRLFAITDAVTETHSGFYQHQLAGDKYECNGVLSGSALSMHKAFLNLVRLVGIEVGEALRMCSLYPAQVLHCDNRYGKIAPGYQGQFLLLNKQLEIVDVITS